jgi:hypothetical protein
MIFLLLILNFLISWFNAWACGKAWPESKHQGGWAHFMNWMGAIMSACGFVWCSIIVFALVGTMIPIDTKDPQHAVYAITPQMIRAVLDLGYVIIIVPVIGSGLAITIDAWAHFYRERTFGNGAIAAYDTAAQIYNMYEAATMLPSVLSDLGSLFGGKSSDSSSSDSDSDGLSGLAIAIVILIVVCALVGGILLTRYIILSTAKSSAADRRFQFAGG